MVEKDQSPEELLRALKRAFNVEEVRLWLEERTESSIQDWRGLLEEQHSCLTACQRTTHDIEALRQRLAKTEADQNALCDSEKFEEAGALDATIQELKDTITRQLEDVAVGARRMEALATSLLSLTRDRASLAENALDRVQELRKDSEQALLAMDGRNDKRLSAEDSRLESERKRMDLANSHIEKDSENLREEWQQVTEAIDQEATDHVEEREAASAQRAGLDEEIQELQRSLDKKMAERKALTEVVDSCDIRIASIRSKFEKQLTRLEGKKKRLEEATREVEQDRELVEQMVANLDQERQVCAESVQQGKCQIAEIQCESRKLRGIRRFMSRNVRMRVAWQKLLEPHHETLNQARLKWEKATRESSELAEASSQREAQAAKLRNLIDTVRLQLPSLEAEKKQAVASRSFKEAGRLTEEIRRRQEEQSVVEAQLEELQSGLASSREALVASRQSEEGAQAELLEAEATTAVEELRILQKQVRDLEALCKTSPIHNSDRQLFEQEMSALQRSQDHLSKKYSIALDSLEEIPSEEFVEDDGDSVGSTQDKSGQLSEDGNGISSGTKEPRLPIAPQAAGAQEAAAPPRPPPPPPAPVSQAAAAPAAPAPAAAPKDIESLRSRRAELAQSIQQCKVREQEIENEVEMAVEADNFDLAEELEEERRRVNSQLCEAQLEDAALEAEFGPFEKDEETSQANGNHHAEEEEEKEREEEVERKGSPATTRMRTAMVLPEASAADSLETSPGTRSGACESEGSRAMTRMRTAMVLPEASEAGSLEASPGVGSGACESEDPADPEPAGLADRAVLEVLEAAIAGDDGAEQDAAEAAAAGDPATEQGDRGTAPQAEDSPDASGEEEF